MLRRSPRNPKKTTQQQRRRRKRGNTGNGKLHQAGVKRIHKR
jgi:hypothetical protein